MHKDFQKKVENFTSFSEILNIRGPYETNIRGKRLFFWLRVTVLLLGISRGAFGKATGRFIPPSIENKL